MVLGDMSPVKFEAQLAHYLKAGFRDFKIKLASETTRNLEKIRALKDAGVASQAVRADANNLWQDTDSAIRDLAALDYRFIAIEEPLRVGDYNGMHRIATTLDTRIILDESLLRSDQLHQLKALGDRWIVNVRVSKMGGLVRAIQIIDTARRHQIPVIVGAHVGETSVLTRAALPVAMRAQYSLFAQEGAFGTHLLARDVVDRPVMFGQNGILDVKDQEFGTLPGFGLPVRHPLPDFNGNGYPQNIVTGADGKHPL